jgi:hypothetical protein
MNPGHVADRIRSPESVAWLHRRAAECARDLKRIERQIADCNEFGCWAERTEVFMNALRQGQGAHAQLRHIAKLLGAGQTPTSDYLAWHAAQFARCSERMLYELASRGCELEAA